MSVWERRKIHMSHINLLHNYVVLSMLWHCWFGDRQGIQSVTNKTCSKNAKGLPLGDPALSTVNVENYRPVKQKPELLTHHVEGNIVLFDVMPVPQYVKLQRNLVILLLCILTLFNICYTSLVFWCCFAGVKKSSIVWQYWLSLIVCLR